MWKLFRALWTTVIPLSDIGPFYSLMPFGKISRRAFFSVFFQVNFLDLKDEPKSKGFFESSKSFAKGEI